MANIIRFPASPDLYGPARHRPSADERQMRRAAGLRQAGDSPRAEQVFCTALLSAQAADMALGPLHGIGLLLAAVRRLSRRRPTPATTAAAVLR